MKEWSEPVVLKDRYGNGRRICKEKENRKIVLVDHALLAGVCLLVYRQAEL